jgi:hypothetical protein
VFGAQSRNVKKLQPGKYKIMKNLLLLTLALFLFAVNVCAQSDVKMRTQYGSENVDLMSVLRFENIGLTRMAFSGADLKDKDFQISIQKIVNGKQAQTEVVFDSKEDSYFKIKSDKFAFRVLTKTTAENTVRFDFQFDGFYKQKEYKIAADQKEFVLKDFLGSQREISIPLNTSTYILTYMMPYLKKDGSKQYCEVVQSGANPAELGKKYAIPTYFLIDIKFQ